MSELVDPPLSGIKIVDAVSGALAPISSYLAHLGAEVDRVHPVDASDPVDLAANAGKVWRSFALDSDEGHALAGEAHIVVAGKGHDLLLKGLRGLRPDLVTMTVSDFGLTGSLSDWRGSNAVLHALSGELSRSGIRGREPLLPPGDLAYQCASVQAAFALCGGLYRALRSGRGAHFDFAALEGAVQALDPGFGISGSATLGKPAGLLSRDRPREGFQYPIFSCADGFVRICLLSKRQWRSMFEWLGRPEQFASPDFDRTSVRYNSPDLLPHIADFFRERNRADLEREGQAHGVPIAAMLSLPEFLETEHVRARDALKRVSVGTTEVTLPRGVQTIDGVRADFDAAAQPADPFPEAVDTCDLPFEGLKVIDLGVIVVGAEQARMLGDLGADVIKMESRSFPDGNRQSYLDFGMSVSFAAGHRNKRSIGLDLRSERGREIFLDLVAEADVVCSNFKPGTMDKLGLGQATLRKTNPRIILSESSAFGSTGPWSNRMGYGPLVRASTGLALAWRYPDDPTGFSDTITIYPDHVAGRICAIGVVALLIRRLRTGRGGTTAVAQAEVVLKHFAAQIARGGDAGESTTGKVVFAAEDDDEWCVVDPQTEQERRSLAELLGVTDPDQIPTALEEWVVAHPPEEAARVLQQAGIPAAPMLRIADLPKHPFYTEREFYRVEDHPWLKETVRAERYVAKTDDISAPPNRPAPLSGEHSEEVLAEWLGVDSAAIASLIEDAVLEPLHEDTRKAAKRHMASSD
ncbi:CoA transferase [Altererythrobacter sp. FM1]|uniref:CaiB/BaiF CoA-transferase family protein n=1 Tax=Tsuneonella flava TaxID=2055955 RepID=UPI000C80D426|nr:CoA transferase [Tsuneonella flava]ROT97058.1 CoA transferase [Altererythrobacter sp. FM1]